MSIQRCLDEKVLAGQLDRRQADEAARRIEERRAALAPSMGEDAAAAAAARDVAEDIARAADYRASVERGHMLAQIRLEARAAKNPQGYNAGAMAVLGRDIRDSDPGANVATRIGTIRGTLESFIPDALNAWRSKAAGLTQDRVSPRNFVRELFGEQTGDSLAAATARGWQDLTDYGVKRFNAALGHIDPLEDWRLPQAHNRDQIATAGYEAWRDFLLPLLDRGKIIDSATMAPMRDARLNQVMRDIFDAVRTDGLSEITPGQFQGVGGVRDRRNQTRFFHFRDADSWLAYNDRFGAGAGGLFDVITRHIDGISRDTALLEIMGPKPQTTARILYDRMRQVDANADLSTLQRSNPLRWALESPQAFWRTWQTLDGTLGAPVSETMRGVFTGIRGFLNSAKMGTALISSVQDLWTFAGTAIWNDLPPVRALAHAISLMNPRSEEGRVFATRMGIDCYATGPAIAARHFDTDTVGSGLGDRMANFVIRASGLGGWTYGLRTSAKMGLLGHLGELVGTEFSDLPSLVGRFLQRYGVTARDWDIVRAADHMRGPNGVQYLDPTAILRDLGQSPERLQAADRIMGAVRQEADFFVPEPDARIRGLLTGGLRAGTFWGEMARSTTMYKGYSISILTTHMMRAAAQPTGGIMGYLALGMIGLTVLGAASLQARQIATGRDPRDMTDPAFWAEAILQGGGLGIFGDFARSAWSRGDQGFLTTLVGPGGGLVEDVARLGLPNLRQAVGGQSTHVGGEIARFVRSYTPGSNLWYTRLGTDRLVMDQLQQMIDPEYRRSFQRMEDRARRDYGQRFFWRPGQTQPERGPDLNAAFGPQ